MDENRIIFAKNNLFARGFRHSQNGKKHLT